MTHSTWDTPLERKMKPKFRMMPFETNVIAHQWTSGRYRIMRNFQRACTPGMWKWRGAKKIANTKTRPKPTHQRSMATSPTDKRRFHVSSPHSTLRSSSSEDVLLGFGMHLKMVKQAWAMAMKNVRIRDMKPFSVRLGSIRARGTTRLISHALDHVSTYKTPTTMGPELFSQRMASNPRMPMQPGLNTLRTSVVSLKVPSKFDTYAGKFTSTPARMLTIW
mmetsp:Transcript_45653/g.141565  ORF Transcript_45653/g.141565 Transcript_45653/m.141565 type:complete len:220 (+) Transcript_45653:935-1594(+)